MRGTPWEKIKLGSHVSFQTGKLNSNPLDRVRNPLCRGMIVQQNTHYYELVRASGVNILGRCVYLDVDRDASAIEKAKATEIVSRRTTKWLETSLMGVSNIWS